MNRLCAIDFLDLLYRLRQQVKWARGATNCFPRNMRVDGCCAQAAMAEQDLNDPDVGAGFKEMGRKGMSERAYRGSFGQTGGSAGLN
jgi:hypothetical protein